jgi:hexosaminidase
MLQNSFHKIGKSKMMKNYNLAILLFLLSFSIISAQSKLLTVVPQPQKITFTEDSIEIRNQNIELQIINISNEPINIAVEELRQTAMEFCNAKLTNAESSEKKIIFGLSSDEEFNGILKQNDLKLDDFLGEEGYKLLINSKEIIIAALHQKGLFYGIQTLKQMMRGLLDNDDLPGLEITDWPSFKYRAISDDISRGPLPTMSYMKYQVRRLAEMKINTIIHYVEHVVKTKSHPEFAPEDGSLTIEEWQEIADYALKYNVTVIGGFQSFGHFNNILNTPEYAHLGESGSLISPMLPESYEFLENIYEEMIPAFHSEFFNVNCDETFDLGKEASKALVDSIGYAGVYYEHMMKLYDIVKKNGKRMIMWGDIMMQHPELLDKLPKDILVGTWDYDDRDTFKNYIDPFKKSGFEFWVVPGVLNSRRIYPNFDKAFKNIKVFIEEGFESGASGVLNCFWDDGSTGLFSNDWYGAAYGADKSWNVYSSDISFDSRYSIGSLGTKDINLMQAIRKINELRFLELTDGMTDKFMFAKLLPEEGKKLKISLADLNKALAIIDEAASFLKNTKLKLYSDDVLYLQFIIDLYRILAQERFDLIDAAERYAKAEKVVLNNPASARNEMVKSIELLSQIIDAQKKSKAEFEILWLKENHIYALDWTVDKYENKINNLISARNLVMKSLRKLDSSKPILTKEDVRLAITKLPGKYFTEWMMPNPIITKDNKLPLEIDYLTDMGGETVASPKVTQEFYHEGEKYRWRRIVSQYPDIINLEEIFLKDNASKVLYSFANISCDDDLSVTASVGFDEGISVFVNGVKVYEKTTSGNMIPDEYQFNMILKKGKNNLLIKTSQSYGEWAFTFRLPNNSVRNSKNRYKIVD